MSSIGIPEDRMVHAVINPETKAPISPVTLRKHFREALDQGLLEADMKAAFNLLKQTESSAAAAIFWVKCRLRWRERVAIEFPGPVVGEGAAAAEDADKHSMLEIARRVAFVLSMGAEAAKPSTPPKPTPQRHKEPA